MRRPLTTIVMEHVWKDAMFRRIMRKLQLLGGILYVMLALNTALSVIILMHVTVR